MSFVLEKIEETLSPAVFAESLLLRFVLPALSLVGITASLVLVFAVVPDERIMGPVQRIFYFHVGAALATYFSVFVLLSGSVFYLIRRASIWDVLAESGALVGLLCASQVLATGMIWGHSAWNVWWRWEPRLVSFLLLWLLLLGYCLLRRLSSAHAKQKTLASVLGIVTAVHVPIVVFSVKLMQASEQLHPQISAARDLKNEWYVIALVSSIVAMLCLSAWLVCLCMQALQLKTVLLNAERRVKKR